VQLAPKPIVLYSFNSQKVVEQWHVFTDSFFGGKSQASLSYNQAEQVRLRMLVLLNNTSLQQAAAATYARCLLQSS
jgi:hypothetical protein